MNVENFVENFFVGNCGVTIKLYVTFAADF